MKILSVHQLTFGFNADQEFGLLYASENPEASSQDIGFFLPVDSEEDLIFGQTSVSFLVGLADIAVPLRTTLSFPEISFKMDDWGQEILFELDLYGSYPDRYFYWPRVSTYRMKKARYIGKHKDIIGKHTKLVPLLPLDLEAMDELFLKQGIIFIGTTPFPRRGAVLG